jgi:O-methyltransferase involved in polyketide biosynthesis
VRAISTGGFDLAQPSVIASTGVTQYISVNAITTTMREAAELASGTTFVCTFVVPIGLMDADEKDCAS